MLPQKQVADVSLVLKDSDMESENLSSFIQLSVSDGQKTDSFKSYHLLVYNKKSELPGFDSQTMICFGCSKELSH